METIRFVRELVPKMTEFFKENALNEDLKMMLTSQITQESLSMKDLDKLKEEISRTKINEDLKFDISTYLQLVWIKAAFNSDLTLELAGKCLTVIIDIKNTRSDLDITSILVDFAFKLSVALLDISSLGELHA